MTGFLIIFLIIFFFLFLNIFIFIFLKKKNKKNIKNINLFFIFLYFIFLIIFFFVFFCFFDCLNGAYDLQYLSFNNSLDKYKNIKPKDGFIELGPCLNEPNVTTICRPTNRYNCQIIDEKEMVKILESNSCYRFSSNCVKCMSMDNINIVQLNYPTKPVLNGYDTCFDYCFCLEKQNPDL